VSRRPDPEGFTRVPATAAEYVRRGTETMLECDRCHARIMPAGAGVGAHRRKHARLGEGRC
jgi:hypothetical protein